MNEQFDGITKICKYHIPVRVLNNDEAAVWKTNHHFSGELLKGMEILNSGSWDAWVE